MEASGLYCGRCKKPYNQTTREPLSLPCCGDGICRACQIILVTPQEGYYQCPICNESNRCDIALKPIIPLKRLLEKFQQVSIYCENHSDVQADYYCKIHKQMICMHCAVQSHGDHNIYFARLNCHEFELFCKKIQEKLREENLRIYTMIEAFDIYFEKDHIYSSKEFVKLVFEAQDAFSARVTNEEDRKTLSYFGDNFQNVDSDLISTKEINQIREWLGKPSFFKMDLLYRGSNDGFSAMSFHKKCDNSGPTITIVKSEFGKIFGGYSSISWTTSQSSYQYFKDDRAFIFSLSNKSKHLQYQNYEYPLCHYKDNLPTFGGGHDIHISNNCNSNSNSYCSLGYNFELPEGTTYNTDLSKNYLAGQHKFKVLDIEVYKVISA